MMTTIPEDLKKVHQTYAELTSAHGKELAYGFLTYMVEVDYGKSDPQRVLSHLLGTWHADYFAHEIEDLLTHRVASDLIKGFAFAKVYSQRMKYTYGAP